MPQDQQATPEAKEGLAVAHLGKGIAVECEGEIILCQPLRKLDTIAVGDRVLWSPVTEGQGRIEAILPRRSLLARPSRNAKVRPVAANIDQVLIVLAVEPPCDFLLVDQYLAVCENSDIDAVLVMNKTDMPTSSTLEDELRIYEALGYPLLRVSTKIQTGLDELRNSLRNKSSVLTGQSGVGKTSIVNTLVPERQLKTNTLSEVSKHGRHTTTAATLYRIEQVGDLIDSPGTSIFGLADLDIRQLAQGYREIAANAGKCKFNDCRHREDKGCAVRAAAENGEIAMSRYQRYVRLTQKMFG